MTTGSDSLQNLHDIVAAAPVPLWPPAPGWILLICLLVLLVLFLLVSAVLRYRRNAYRRAALAELHRAAASPEPLPLIAALLKRTALAAYAREEVANLSGETWTAWLAATGGREVPAGVAAALQQGIYDGSVTDVEALRDFTGAWIRRHRGGQ